MPCVRLCVAPGNIFERDTDWRELLYCKQQTAMEHINVEDLMALAWHGMACGKHAAMSPVMSPVVCFDNRRSRTRLCIHSGAHCPYPTRGRGRGFTALHAYTHSRIHAFTHSFRGETGHDCVGRAGLRECCKGTGAPRKLPRKRSRYCEALICTSLQSSRRLSRGESTPTASLLFVVSGQVRLVYCVR
jgi:hypothetical protein